MQRPLTDLVVLAWVVCWAGALVCICLSGFYTMKTMRRFKPDRQWGKFFAPALFMNSFFTEEGDLARGRLWRAIAGFLAFSYGAIGIAVVIAP